MTNASINDRIKHIICENVAPEIESHEVNDTVSLIDDLNLVSIQILELIVQLEKEFGIELQDEDLDIASFANINAVAKLVEKRTNSESP